MTSLDQYFEYLSRREAEDAEAQAQAFRTPAADAAARAIRSGQFRWGLRGGLTVRVPVLPTTLDADPVGAPTQSDRTAGADDPPTVHAELAEFGDIESNAEDSLAAESDDLIQDADEAGQIMLPLMPPAERSTVPGAMVSPAEAWMRLPEHVRVLMLHLGPDSVDTSTDPNTPGDARAQILERLMDPTVTLEEASKLLGVCTTTVRRYANRGRLSHQRTPGNQRRFRLSEIALFLARQANGESGE